MNRAQHQSLQLVLISLFLLMFFTALSIAQAEDAKTTPPRGSSDSEIIQTRQATPRSQLRLVRTDLSTDSSVKVPPNTSLPRSAEIYFEVETHWKGSYLYLLQKSGGTLQILSPATGLVWLNRPQEIVRVVPRGSNEDAQSPAGLSWNADQTGALDFILVGTEAPRDVPSDSQVSSLERFLAPPPFLKGPLTQPGVVLETVRVVWQAEDP